MSALRSARAAWACGAVFASVFAALGEPQALAIGVSLTKTATVPVVSVPSLPSLTTPSVGASVPSVNVSVAGTEVSTPSVSVTGPSASVSGEGVSVTGPGVGVSEPSPPGGGGSPPPTSPSPPGKTGGGDPPATPGSPSNHDSGSSAAGAGRTSTTSSTPAQSGLRGATDDRSRSPAGTHGLALAQAPPRGHRSSRDRNAGSAGASAAGTPVTLRSGATRAPGASPSRTRGPTRSSGGLLDRIGRHIPLAIPVPNWSKPIILVLLLLAIGFGARACVSGIRVRRLERQRTTMQRDLDVMQAALVPRVPAEIEGLRVSVAYRPAEGPAAGGDFYDLFVLEPGRVAVILGDVAGHGRQALEQAALTRYTLRAYLQAGLEPRATLALAGKVLADPTCEHYATVAVAVYDAGEGRLTYSCAGHPPPIVHGLQGYEPLTLCASTPIGWRAPTGRRQTTLSLPPGAIACFFSDGLIEARRGAELLGRERVSELLAALGPRPAAEDLLARVEQAALTTPDDMAACILLANTATEYARTEELELDAHQLDRPSTRRFLEACGAQTYEIDLALEGAAEVAGACGGALLRVDMGPAGAVISARMPGSPERSWADVEAPSAHAPAHALLAT
jgi:Stage II sporulation protein E (SpoIIE)